MSARVDKGNTWEHGYESGYRAGIRDGRAGSTYGLTGEEIQTPSEAPEARPQIVGVCAAPKHMAGSLVAVASDGRAYLYYDRGAWSQLPPVPLNKKEKD